MRRLILMLKGDTLREVMNELGRVSEEVSIRHYQRIVARHRNGSARVFAHFGLRPSPWR